MTTGITAREARRATRRHTRAASTMRVDGSRAIDVVVHDISATGIRFSSIAALLVGDEITIGLAGAGSTRGFVAWRRGDQYGCDFVVPIGEDVAARAFSGDTVVRFGGAPAAPADDAARSAATIAAQVDALYARHRRWAFPLDVALAAATVVIVAITVLCHL